MIWGPNWEELLGGEFEKRPATATSRPCKRRCTGSLKTPHDVPAAPVRTLPQSQLRGDRPSGAIYKREEDGIVLIDQDNAVAGVCALAVVRTKKSTSTEKRQVRKMYLLLSAN